MMLMASWMSGMELTRIDRDESGTGEFIISTRVEFKIKNPFLLQRILGRGIPSAEQLNVLVCPVPFTST